MDWPRREGMGYNNYNHGWIVFDEVLFISPEGFKALLSPYIIFNSLNIKKISKELKLRKCTLPPSFIDFIYSLPNIRNQLIIFPERQVTKRKKLPISPIIIDEDKSVKWKPMIMNITMDYYHYPYIYRLDPKPYIHTNYLPHMFVLK